jgi:two-component system cell cycle response regulator CpdR
VRMIDDIGCDVVTASTGREALELLSTHQRIEMLITDVNMPVMGGYELVERAKRLRKQLQVILLSGRETDGHANQ